MTVRLRSRKPYFSAWVPVTGAALALLLCAGFTVLAVLQADKSWTFIMLAILCFLIAGYVLLSSALNKGLTDCVLLSETGATVRRAFKKSVFYPYEQLEVAFGKVDGRDCFLFLVKEEAGDREELLDVSHQRSEAFFCVLQRTRRGVFRTDRRFRFGRKIELICRAAAEFPRRLFLFSFICAGRRAGKAARGRGAYPRKNGKRRKRMEQSVIKRLLAQSCRPARRSPETEELYGHYWAEERAFFERLSADAPALAQPYDALQRLYCDWAYEAGADRFAEGVRLGILIGLEVSAEKE